MKKNTFNYLNSISCLLAILLFIVTPFEVLADESTYREYVDSDQNVRLVSISQKNFKAGDVTPLVMKFESDKFRYVNELKVTVKSNDDTPGAFAFDTLNESITLKYFYEDTTISDAYLRISPSLKAGVYPLTFEYEYYDVTQRYTGEETINVTVTGRSDKFLYIEGGRFDNVNIDDSNKAELIVNITNPSDYYYQYVEVYFNSEDSAGFSLYDSFKPVFIEGIFPHETVTATFPIYVDSSVSTGNHPINLTLNYNSSDWNKMNSIEDIYVEVIRDNSSSDGGSTEGGTPRIIISSYDINVEQVQAGKGFSLDFGLKNTSTTNAVSNIKVVVSSTTATGSGSSSTSGEVFFPSEGSNSFYIDSIPIGGISTQNIDLMTKQDVEPGVYSVLLKIDYEYGDGQSVSTEEQIAFSVTQEQRLEIQGITPPMFGQMGTTMPVSFQFINKGKAIIYNMSVTADGDFEIEGGDSYVGNLPAGYNDYYDAYLIPTKGGESTGAIVLKFEDSVGNPQEVRSEFTVMIDEGFPDMGMGDMGMGGDYGIGGFDNLDGPYIDSMGGISPEYVGDGGLQEDSSNTPILVGMVLMIGFIGFMVIKNSKAKKLAELEVDEDEDD